MAKRLPAETTEWVAGNLRKARGISGVEILSDQALRICRERYATFVAGVVSERCVEVEDIKTLVASGLGVEIIANVPKDSFWTGKALQLAIDNDIATGAYGDLLRVIDCQDVRSFRSKETEFIERGLRQHDRISRFDRVHDRLYRLHRIGLPDLTVVMLNEYEMTADHLRVARDRYGVFSVAVITNPNGRCTGSAEQVAKGLGVQVLNWGEFFGRLNRE